MGDHNELRNDPDPKGWELFLKVIKNPATSFIDFVYEVCIVNPESGELQVKSLDKFILAKNTEYAITAASNIAKHHSRYEKSQRALEKFETYIKKDADTSKLNAAVAEKLKDFQNNLLPEFEKAKYTKAEAANVMEYAYELMKADPKTSKLKKQVVDSLKKDKLAHTKAYLAVKIHKRLLN